MSAYRFPPDLDYPRVHYDRILERKTTSGRIDLSVEGGASAPIDLGPVQATPAPPPIQVRPAKKKLDIKIRGRRTRGT